MPSGTCLWTVSSAISSPVGVSDRDNSAMDGFAIAEDMCKPGSVHDIALEIPAETQACMCYRVAKLHGFSLALRCPPAQIQ